jgi:hypothetical protein
LLRPRETVRDRNTRRQSRTLRSLPVRCLGLRRAAQVTFALAALVWLTGCTSDAQRVTEVTREFIRAAQLKDGAALADRLVPEERQSVEPDGVTLADAPWDVPWDVVGAHVEGNWALVMARARREDLAAAVPFLLHMEQGRWLIAFVSFNVAELGLISDARYRHDPIPSTFMGPVRDMRSRVWREEDRLAQLVPGVLADIVLSERVEDPRRVPVHQLWRFTIHGVHETRVTVTTPGDARPSLYLYSPEGGGLPSEGKSEQRAEIKLLLGNGTYLLRITARERTPARVEIVLAPRE